MKNLWIILTLVVVVGGAVWYFSFARPQEPNKIVVGSVLALTGDAAVDSLNVQRGMELARADLAKEGIAVDIKYEDDQTDSAKTVLATQRLISLYRPQALIGFTWDFLLDAATPVITQAKIPTFSPSNTPETSSSRSEYIFFGPPLNTTKTQPVADFLKQHQIKTAAIVIQNSAWGFEHIDIYKKAAALAGTTILSVDKTDFGQENSVFPTIVTKIKQEKAAALLWSGPLVRRS